MISLCWDSSSDIISGSLGKGFPLMSIATAYLQQSFNIFLNTSLSSSVGRSAPKPSHDLISLVRSSKHAVICIQLLHHFHNSKVAYAP